ncbi:MAG: M48 family metallopeptidase [Deltaproteobacteria bacterium]|nr:M48 family metallopeptidase [Deltaproteobacteria bacterium]
MTHWQDELFNVNEGSLRIEESDIPFRIKKNTRLRHSRLLISPEEGLIIEGPKKISLLAAQHMIEQRKDWVLKSLKGYHKQQEKKKDLKTRDDSILVFGKEKILEIRKNAAKDFVYETKQKIILGFHKPTYSGEELEQALTNWFKRKAKSYLPLRVNMLNKSRFDISNVVIKNQKTLWGSCSSKKTINLNWRLVLAPRFASDYIIMHELCHTKHMNHSKAFWQLVERHVPEYKKAEKWFDDYGFLLSLNFVE